ncbi:hypothetical protein TWF694_008878 [Orbilia ellipsospora]|uniref:N-acetyltransferase domain-containing protein n=1 Tax=Orbilia ellipsospora TaxID=2528407 RepID=A0AAV9XDB5_9PEZI
MATSTATPTYRTATLRDVQGIAECAAEGMLEDELFAALWPRRKEYPSHYAAYFARRARQRLVDQNIVTLIAELPIADEKGVVRNRIVGFAQWQRFGGGSVETRWSPLKACERRLLAVEEWVTSFFTPKVDPASDPEAVSAFSRDFAELENIYWHPSGIEHGRWHLQLLCVSSNARRKGIGGKLVDLGVERAKRDGCDASLEASPMGLPLYQARGFEVIGVYKMEVKGADGEGISTPVLLWRNPNKLDS